MAGVAMTNEVLGRPFITALLLTGSTEETEVAVLEGIKAMERHSFRGDALLQGTIAASIPTNIREELDEGQEQTSSVLPVELRRVLRLSQELRRCYVLRVLLGLPREICARMLRTEIHRIDELVCVSARALACLPEEPTSALEYAAATAG
jgi:hypothetical protein